MKALSLGFKCLILVLSICTVSAAPSLKEFNRVVSQELSKVSTLKMVYNQSINKYGCSDVSVPLDVVNCHINTDLVEGPTLVQYQRGSDGGIYRGSLFYLESGTQSMRFAAIDIFFQHQVLDNGSEVLDIIKVEKNNIINTP